MDILKSFNVDLVDILGSRENIYFSGKGLISLNFFSQGTQYVVTINTNISLAYTWVLSFLFI